MKKINVVDTKFHSPLFFWENCISKVKQTDSLKPCALKYKEAKSFEKNLFVTSG